MLKMKIYWILFYFSIFCLCLVDSDVQTRKPAFYDIPMYGNLSPLGAFYIKANIGKPPQPFNLLLDTGSTDLLLPSINCTSCISKNRYNSTASTSASTKYPCDLPGHCGIGDVYGGGESSAVGFVMADFITVTPGLPAVEVVLNQVMFEAVIEGQSFLNPPIDGLVGLAFPANSKTNSLTFFDVLVQNNYVSDRFSHCLGNNGGHLVLGGANSSYYTGDFRYTPIVSESFYVVNMTDMRVNGTSLGIPWNVYNRDDTIVDSGTTELIIPSQAFEVLSHVLYSICRFRNLHGICDVAPQASLFHGHCYTFSQAELEAFPPLELVFHPTSESSKSPVFTLEPEWYLFQQQNNNQRCLGVISLAGYEGTTVGDVFLQAYTTMYDIANLQVGWAPVVAKNCI